MALPEQDHWQELNEFHSISYSIFTLVIPVSLFSLTHSSLRLCLLRQPPPTLPHPPPCSPPWLRSCSFIPRGEEQAPIITQVSVKWIIGRLIELHDGKHPSWVVRLSVLSPLPHLSADAQGWYVCILNATAERDRVWSATTVCSSRRREESRIQGWCYINSTDDNWIPALVSKLVLMLQSVPPHLWDWQSIAANALYLYGIEARWDTVSHQAVLKLQHRGSEAHKRWCGCGLTWLHNFVSTDCEKVHRVACFKSIRHV